jgi:hypothetical protein
LQAKSAPGRPPQHAQGRSAARPARGVIQRARIKDIKGGFSASFKYSDRMDNPYVMIDAGGGWHLSFHPDGEGGEAYKKAVIDAALEYSYTGKNVNDRKWVEDWMTQDLPFSTFHVTAPSGNHYFFTEKGQPLGEQKKGANITEEERIKAWRLSGVVTHGSVHPEVGLSGQYNWAPKDSPIYRTSPHGFGQVLTGVEKPRTDEAWPKAKLKKGKMEYG